MQAETLYRFVFDEKEMDALLEIMMAVVEAELVDGHALALARVFTDAAWDESDDDEPQVVLN